MEPSKNNHGRMFSVFFYLPQFLLPKATETSQLHFPFEYHLFEAKICAHVCVFICFGATCIGIKII